MTQPEAWLALRAQSGDRAALETLPCGVQPVLQRYLVGLIRDQAAADDELQETLFRIYRKLRFVHDPALFRPWAYRITSREAFRGGPDGIRLPRA